MTDQWYFRKPQSFDANGPFSFSELKQFVREGRIRGDTPIRSDGDATWTYAYLIDGLIDAQSLRPAPAPAADETSDQSAASFANVLGPDGVGRNPPYATPSSHSNRAVPYTPAVKVALVACIGVLFVCLSIAASIYFRSPEPAEIPNRPIVTKVEPRTTDAKKNLEEPPRVQTPVTQPVAEPNPAPIVSVAPAAITPVVTPAEKAVSRQRPQDIPSPTTLTTEQVIANVDASVALVAGRRSGGTGFLIQPNVLVTNKHVISSEQIESIRIFFPSAKAAERGPYRAKLLYKDPARDLAFLSVETKLKPLMLAENYKFRRGQDVVVIGNPGTEISDDSFLMNAVSKGVMSAETKVDGQPYFQLTLTVNHGNSGGPVLDSTGQVLGVVTLKSVNQEGMGFCIPAAEVQASLARMPK